MNSNSNPAQKKSALKRLKERALAIIVLPTWPDDIMHEIKAERTRMLLCILIKTLETYFKDRVSCIANACAIAYNSGERASTAREIVNETIGIVNYGVTNKLVEMSNWQRADANLELVAADFLTLLGENFRFLFLISEDNSPIKALGKIFPSLSANYLSYAGECFVCYPGAAYCEAIKLPGNKGH